MGIVFTLVALVGLLAALGHVGYVAMLNNAAKKKGAAGTEIARYSRSRFPVAAGATGVSLLGLLLTSGGTVTAIIGMIIALGGGAMGYRGLQQERSKYPTSS
ncbi:hypothetical protein GCM10009836_68330 [Pseudonocardia ailaonensis]|uniref:DUF3784 domain-containing protein n=1 Tax=Pseudonocardia ailaonensis TaxID=367279 RepID=A0ABN2NNG2_9PSEU